MTMTGPTHETRDDLERGRSLTPSTPMDDSRSEGVSPGRSWNAGDDTTLSQPTHSPDASRRKRLSFFGRASSEASKRSSSLNPASRAPMFPQQSEDIIDPLNPPAQILRPSTPAKGRRKTSDQFDIIRRSLFRMRRGTSSRADQSTPRPSSQHTVASSQSGIESPMTMPDVNNGLIPFVQGSVPPQSEPVNPKPGQFKTAKEYYHHRKKSSISPPFNFQHVTHTAKKHLPKLDTVDEKDLPAKFWAVNAHQRPKQRLHGIKADDLDNHRSRSLSGASYRPSITKHTNDEIFRSQSMVSHTVTDSVDETTFDETVETIFNPDDAYKSLEEVNNTSAVSLPNPGAPKHYSSMSALRSSPSQQKPHHIRDQLSLDDRKGHRSPGNARSQPMRASLPLDMAPTLDEAFADLPPADATVPPSRGQSKKEKQSLPSLPKDVPKNDSKMSLDRSPSYSLFPVPPLSKAESLPSMKSKRSPKSTATRHTSKSSSSRRTDILEEPTWEDDIDFAYEQEAEGRCDFDWETASSPLIEVDEGHLTPDGSGTDSPGGGVRLSAWLEQPGALHTKSSLSTTRSSTDTGALGLAQGHRKRGSSVGHKGFAAARNAVIDGASKSSPSLLSLDMVCGPAGTPPPRVSVAGPDIEEKPACVTPELQFPTFDAVTEYLSDPESTRTGGSKHRKSSSFGSCQSSGRSLQTASDTARWSSASTSSVPDLLYSKRFSRSSLGKSRLSRPLESVPHSPDSVSPEQVEDVLSAAPMPVATERAKSDSILMRRPETSSDREILFSAGRTVQRGRSGTPNRMQRRVAPSPDKKGEGWI